MTLLATYVQISDLHIGLPEYQTGNARTTADLRRLASTFRFFHGSLGHQLRSLQYLEDFVEDLRTAGEPFEVIVTGDVTRCGDQGELDLAHRYLTDYIGLPPSRPQPTGLNLKMLPTLRVGGNHDHWGGYNLPSSTVPSQFYGSPLRPAAPFPYVINGPTLLGRQLVFIGIDSDADVTPGSRRRLLAHGAFVSQINALQPLPPNTTNELRVLVIHHARHASGHVLRMATASRRALDAFIAAKDVRVVLSGHTHQAYTRPAVAGVPELCSASTTQIDQVPAGWVNIWNRPPTVSFDKNGFLVHRLHDDRGSLRWDVHTMSRDPQATGFQEVLVHPITI